MNCFFLILISLNFFLMTVYCNVTLFQFFQTHPSKMSKPDPKTEIRKLPFRFYRDLSSLLDIPGDKDWKKLISVLPEGMYNRNEVGHLKFKSSFLEKFLTQLT